MKKNFKEPLYEDNHLLVVEKPAMLPVQADSSGDINALDYYKECIREKYSKPGNVYLGLVHRLDRPVGGLLVFARTSKAAARLQQSMKNNLWKKQYIAVHCGHLFGSGIWEDYMLRISNSSSSIIAKSDTLGAKYAKLEFEQIQQKGDLSLSKINLITGRHHQIRVQSAHRSLPIWGDARYNKISKPGQNIALYACDLEFPHPTKEQIMSFCSMPEDKYPWSEFDLESTKAVL